MWIIAYIWNGKTYYSSYISYEKALAQFGVLVVSGQRPSIHFSDITQPSKRSERG